MAAGYIGNPNHPLRREHGCALQGTR
jgi:hypothetical protein